MVQINFRSMKIASLVATGFYSGHFPFAPGTFGSFAAVLLWYLLKRLGVLVTPIMEIELILLCFIAGVVSCRVLVNSSTERAALPVKDPSYIVIDEWAGIFISVYGIPTSNFAAILIAFALFRFFDIIKIGPVGWSERLPDAWGIMLDDTVAGVFTCVLIHILVI